MEEPNQATLLDAANSETIVVSVPTGTGGKKMDPTIKALHEAAIVNANSRALEGHNVVVELMRDTAIQFAVGQGSGAALAGAILSQRSAKGQPQTP